VFPEITEMQARAIFEAAAAVEKSGIRTKVEVMVPLIAFKRELDLQAETIHRVAREVMAATGQKFDYQVGTMIELPRAAIAADQIAETAQFFSFGTNDLTQTALGMSRDDSGSFLPGYSEREIIKDNPFASIDVGGVGVLVDIACKRGRMTRPDIKLGICGEHGGDPASIRFFESVGLAYVSCSPFRVPVARLAAAKVAVELGTSPKQGKGKGAKVKSAKAASSKSASKSKPAKAKSAKSKPAKGKSVKAGKRK
jgi:pyruvate,orthophosphate dikinase